VRQGAIARIRDYLELAAKSFLLDCPAFPGNSGGPVVLKQERYAVEGTTPIPASYLIGVVQSYITYGKEAVIAQPPPTPVLFDENTGLTNVVPVQYLIELVELARGSGWVDDIEAVGDSF
jgi:hypothetical protein